MGSVCTMDERKGVSNWVAIACITLMTLLALTALQVSRRKHPAVESKVASTVHPMMPTARLWLSTADRRLRLARQPDIEMSADE